MSQANPQRTRPRTRPIADTTLQTTDHVERKSSMITDLFFVKLQDKRIAFLRTGSGQFWDITGCEPSRYSKFGINLHGVLRNARRVSAEYVTNLLSEHPEEYKQLRVRAKGKASKIRRFRKEKQEALESL